MLEQDLFPHNGLCGRLPRKLAPMSKEASLALQELLSEELASRSMAKKLQSYRNQSDNNCSNNKSSANLRKKLKRISEGELFAKDDTIEAGPENGQRVLDLRNLDKHDVDQYSSSFSDTDQPQSDIDDLNQTSNFNSNNQRILDNAENRPAEEKVRKSSTVIKVKRKARPSVSTNTGNNSCSDFVSHVDSGFVDGEVDSRIQTIRSTVRFEFDNSNEANKVTKLRSKEDKKLSPPSPENFSDIFDGTNSCISSHSDNDFKDIVIPLIDLEVERSHERSQAKQTTKPRARKSRHLNTDSSRNVMRKELSFSCSNLGDMANNNIDKQKHFISDIRTHNDIRRNSVENNCRTSRTDKNVNNFNRTELHDNVNKSGKLTARGGTASLERRNNAVIDQGVSGMANSPRAPRRSTKKSSAPRPTDLKRSSSVPRLTKLSVRKSPKEATKEVKNDLEKSGVLKEDENPDGKTNTNKQISENISPRVAVKKNLSVMESLQFDAAERKAAARRRREEAAKDREMAIVKVQHQDPLEQHRRYWFNGLDHMFGTNCLPVVEDEDEEELRLEEEYRARAVSKCEAWLKNHHIDIDI